MRRGRFRSKRWVPQTSDKRPGRFRRERPARKNTPRMGNKQCFQLFSEVEQNVAAFGNTKNRLLLTTWGKCRARVASSQPIHTSRARIRHAALENCRQPTTVGTGCVIETRY